MDNFFNIYKDDRYSQTRAYDYNLWVKNVAWHLYNKSPSIYAVSKKTDISTPDGPMLRVIINDDVVNPDNEPIAEISINKIIYYIYDDHLYGVAQKSRYNIIYTDIVRQLNLSHDGKISQAVSHTPIDEYLAHDPNADWSLNVSMYRIGEDPIIK